jgi:hypothetical protein
MSIRTSGFWIVAVIAAGAIGWFAAMEVNRGPALASEQDAYERFSNAFTITDSMERIDVLSRLIGRLTPETLPGAVRAIKDDLEDVYNNDLRMLMWYWAKQDPRGMLKEMQTWPEVRAQRMAAGEAVYWILKREGYDAARVVFDELPNHQRDPALAHLVLAYLESGETPNLIALIDSYQMPEEREFVAGIVVGQILQANGPEALAKWIESLPEGPGTSNDLKVISFRAAQTELMRRDHFEFLESWLDRSATAEWAKGGRRAIGIHLAKRDPMRAIEWARGLAPENDRDVVLSETLRAFASYDRVGALEWMRGEKPEPVLDEAAARLAYEFATRNPVVALEMIGRIQGAEMFAKTEKMLTFQWKSVSKEAKEKLLTALAEVPRPGTAAAVSPAPSTPTPTPASSEF